VSRIAVIGSGIAGLSAAYFLSRKHEVTVFESDRRIGGHTHTVVVGRTPVDTGFIVHNERTYPHFCKLIAELGVEKQDSDMSFGVRTETGDFEYSSRGVAGFFAQASNAFNPRHYLLLKEIFRFNREGPRFLKEQSHAVGVTLGEFLAQRKYAEVFIERYLYPMASAVWSMPMQDMAGFPILTLLRFFDNHGMLGINTHPQWKVLKGGSHSYFDPLTRPFRERIHKGVQILAVRRGAHCVGLQLAGQSDPLPFDHVVFACHGNQVLPMLADATDLERDVLENFQTSRNETWLHTDTATLPKRAAARASWNYCLAADGKVNVTYHMNRLQSLTDTGGEQYCVTLNPREDSIESARVIRKMVYHHPMYTRAAVTAQGRWNEISHSRTHFCGAYWFYGFHEDGVRSAVRVAHALDVAV
jgi:uncharacterized protein